MSTPRWTYQPGDEGELDVVDTLSLCDTDRLCRALTSDSDPLEPLRDRIPNFSWPSKSRYWPGQRKIGMTPRVRMKVHLRYAELIDFDKPEWHEVQRWGRTTWEHRYATKVIRWERDPR